MLFVHSQYLITHKALFSSLAESMLAVTALSITKISYPKNPLAEVTMGLTQIAIDQWLSPFEELALTIQDGAKRLLEKYRNQINPILYKAKWFPYMLIIAPRPARFMNDINNIVETSIGVSNNMIKRLDKCVFGAFSDTYIDEIRKGWRENNIDKPILRTMNQAIAAYRRKEYAITSIVLSSLWEGIIADRKGQPGYRIQGKTKEHFKSLVSANDLPQIYVAFFNDYIHYICTSKNAVIEDVPGRNSNQHGWMNKYPSKKAALNAILFTVFLLALEPGENIEAAS